MWAPFSTFEEFQAIVRRNVEHSDRDSYATILKETGEPVGSTSFLDKRPEHKGVEIGGTWIGRPHQGTFVNPEAKFLMLRHGFETLGCIRVQLKTDENNFQSRRAMEKLGCKFEGILRNHMICYDGRLRNSAFYSVTDAEWPSIKERLTERLGYEPIGKGKG